MQRGRPRRPTGDRAAQLQEEVQSFVASREQFRQMYLRQKQRLVDLEAALEAQTTDGQVAAAAKGQQFEQQPRGPSVAAGGWGRVS